MNPIDKMAWQVIRLTGLFQAKFYELLSSVRPPTSLRDKVDYITKIQSGYYLWSTPPENVPSVIRMNFIMWGRIILAIIIFACITNITGAFK